MSKNLDAALAALDEGLSVADRVFGPDDGADTPRIIGRFGAASGIYGAHRCRPDVEDDES